MSKLNPYANLALNEAAKEWQLKIGRLVIETRPADECSTEEGRQAFDEMTDGFPEDSREAFELLERKRQEYLKN